MSQETKRESCLVDMSKIYQKKKKKQLWVSAEKKTKKKNTAADEAHMCVELAVIAQ
jgi:hypothetical protein